MRKPTPLKVISKRFRRKVLSENKRKERRKHSFKARGSIRFSYLFDKRVSAPPIFSLSQNRDKVIKFIKDLDDNKQKGKSVFVFLHKIEVIDIEAIVLLLGIMAEFKSSSIQFNGNKPTKKEVENVLNRSGFFERLYQVEEEHYTFGKKSGIYTLGVEEYNEDITCEALCEAMVCVYGGMRRNTGARKVMLEAHKNTIAHASLTYNKKKKCYISFKEDKFHKTLTVSILDYGIGIFKSLSEAEEGSPGYNFFKKMANFRWSNQQGLKKIMEGELKNISRSGYPNRGFGLPAMKKAIESNHISKLVIVSNDVYADIGNDYYEKLNYKLSGTLIQFQIVPTCNSLPYVHYN